MADKVTVTIDGRNVTVPAGTGLVEAAAAGGIEIPVFCYEPRIGPAVGACRMCLVEIQGVPKLQAACATAVRPGMVVSTANARAREAQEGVVEFLLLNHPLDCPVCDKGGECPLQDQSYRWGSGKSRQRGLKRNNDKPIPVSPLIALDRERCILCYRCTRFSSDVAEDNQLIARDRGANSVIATFEGRPYDAHFSGNIIELCPVGALTSTEYRFRARPWEAPEHPSICDQCSVGCNTSVTVREGKSARVLSRQNDAVDEGWLCDRGRFTYPTLQAPERITGYARVENPDRPAGNSPEISVSAELAMEWLYQKLTEAPATWLLSGNETLEEAWAIQQLASATKGRVVALEGGSAAAPAPGATLADVPAANEILVLGDDDLVDIAPIVELRVRKAMRSGANVTVAGIGGTGIERSRAELHAVAPGEVEQFVRDLTAGKGDLSTLSKRLSDAERVVVIAPDGLVGEVAYAELAEKLGLANDGSGILAVAATANARGLAALGIEPVTIRDLAESKVAGLVTVGVDPSRTGTDAEWVGLIKSATWRAAISLLPTLASAHAELVLGATAASEKEGTLVNLEGRVQRLTVGAPPPDGMRSELSLIAGLARRFGVTVPGFAAGAFKAAAADNTGRFGAVKQYADIPAEGVVCVTGGSAARSTVWAPAQAAGKELSLYVAPFLYAGDYVRAAPLTEFLREDGVVHLARADAQALGVVRGDTIRFGVDGKDVLAKVAVSKRIAAGHARIHTGSTQHPRLRRGFHAITADKVSVTEPTTEVAG